MSGSESLGFISYRIIVELNDDDESEKEIALTGRRKIFTIIMICISLFYINTHKYM